MKEYEKRFQLYPPFEKGGIGGIRIMLPYNKDLKKYSRELRKNIGEFKIPLNPPLEKGDLWGGKQKLDKNLKNSRLKENVKYFPQY